MKIVAKLRSKLLTENKYDRLSKPLKNHKAKIQLTLSNHLFQVVDLVSDRNSFRINKIIKMNFIIFFLQSSNGILKTNFLIMSAWDDEHLVWNLSDYNNIEAVRFNHYEIWKPDLCVWNYDKGYIDYDYQNVDLNLIIFLF